MLLYCDGIMIYCLPIFSKYWVSCNANIWSHFLSLDVFNFAALVQIRPLFTRFPWRTNILYTSSHINISRILQLSTLHNLQVVWSRDVTFFVARSHRMLGPSWASFFVHQKFQICFTFIHTFNLLCFHNLLFIKIIITRRKERSQNVVIFYNLVSISFVFYDCFNLLVIKSECYEELGCFSNDYPWSSAFRPAFEPASPVEINTTFYIQNRWISKI